MKFAVFILGFVFSVSGYAKETDSLNCAALDSLEKSISASESWNHCAADLTSAIDYYRLVAEELTSGDFTAREEGQMLDSIYLSLIMSVSLQTRGCPPAIRVAANELLLIIRQQDALQAVLTEQEEQVK